MNKLLSEQLAEAMVAAGFVYLSSTKPSAVALSVAIFHDTGGYAVDPTVIRRWLKGDITSPGAVLALAYCRLRRVMPTQEADRTALDKFAAAYAGAEE